MNTLPSAHFPKHTTRRNSQFEAYLPLPLPNMSRNFSSAVRAAVRILWTFNSTAKILERDIAAVEQAVRANPELAKKVKKGLIK